MTEPSTAPQLCSQCNTRLDVRRVTIAERCTDSTIATDWTFCSWACARELVIRLVRLGRDEH
ncbi:MAG: hypothetical protein ABIV94_05215 [Acidimicrobiales bacterium]